MNTPVKSRRGNVYVVERLVRWGECDPAGIVYTPNFIDYAVDSSRLLVREMARRALGDGRMPRTPVKALTITFHKALRFDEWFAMELAFTRLGRSSFDIAVKGFCKRPRQLSFETVVTFVNVDPKPHRPRPLPAKLRALIESHLKKRR